ncbi:MAG: nitrophenyl compound nitroreductase subunit ArsF family protein [Planctomycetota bacterium]
MKARIVTGRLLLAFVLFSIGFAVGKEVERNRILAKGGVSEPPAASDGDKVIVYYMHASFRCVTCNEVEAMAEELLRTEFAEPLKTGRLEWKPVNFQENEQLARRYDVGGNMIVVARFRDGKELEHKRLDRVMDLVNNQDEFMSYVRKAIRDCLGMKA